MTSLKYDAAAAHRRLDAGVLAGLQDKLIQARDEALADVKLLRSGGKVPKEKEPLDSGFIDWPQRLLEEYDQQGAGSQVGRLKTCAAELRERLDRVVMLGIGGSYMGALALQEALLNPYHNERPRVQRQDIPRLYYEGNNLDNDTTSDLLELLASQCTDSADLLHRWGIVVISKSGGTLETAVSFRIFRDALEHYYGADTEAARKYVVPVTGETGKLRDISNVKQYPVTFPIPDGIGGRFSVLTAVGLLPAAIMGLDIVQLLRGAAEFTENFRTAGPGSNPTLDYTATCAAWEQRGAKIRILSTWGAKLEALGFWYDQLLSESLGKREQGATPITVVNTRDLHSRGQQHQEGQRDKLITNVIVERTSRPSVTVPSSDLNQDDLNKLAGRPLSDLLSAAIQGTNKAYADVNRPTADIRLPELNEYAMGELFQMLMLATVVEGRMLGINPYGQPGVEDYKRNTKAILKL